MRSFLFVLSIVAVGCGNKSSGTASEPVASCMMPTIHGCREYRGANLAAGSDNLAKLCAIAGTTSNFTMTACPTADIVGACAKPEGKDFYYKGFDLADMPPIEKDCKQSGGTWSK